MSRTTDGTILSGGFTIDLVTATLTVIVDTYSISRPGSTIVQTDEDDEPIAAIHYDGLMTGTATISVTATTGQADFRGDTFITSDMTGSSQTFIINESSPSGSKTGLTTHSISFTQKFS